MLVEFRLQNFKCFRDEQVFSLVASADESHPENVADLATGRSLRLLKSAVLYGANASGKTSLLDGLHFFFHFIRGSARRGPDTKTDITPFLLGAESATKPSSFEATFVAGDGVLYRYGFALDQVMVFEEWLTAYPTRRQRLLFRRTVDPVGTQDFEFGIHLKGEKERLKDLTRPNALFLSVGATFNHPQLTPVYRWLAHQTRGLQTDRFHAPLVPILEDKKVQPTQIRELLTYADLGVVDFQVTEKEVSFGDAEGAPQEVRNVLQALLDSLPKSRTKSLSIKLIHQTRGGPVSFDLTDESGGTRQMFALGPFLLSALAHGGLIFVDELDASLHPLLVRALVRLFHNPQANPKNAQLVFNTHDTSLLSSAIFRRDQIWLVEKDLDGASCIYSLLQYSPRKDEALERGYLQGRYGAIPFLGEPPEGLLIHD